MSKVVRYFSILLLLIVNNKVHAQRSDTMVWVGGQALHFQITKGTGMPILFESGNGDDGSVWQGLIDSIHYLTDATLITYDRAGLGKSGIDTSTTSFKREVRNLKRALRKIGYAEDIFIVSHSFGGVYSTLFANKNHRKVKGVVFIDVMLPCFFTEEWSKEFAALISNENWALIEQYKIGLYHILKNLESISSYMKDISLPEEIPLTLIAAENILPMVKEDERDHWRNCLQSYGSLPNHTYILAKNADHKVWESDANLVIHEILTLYNQVNE